MMVALFLILDAFGLCVTACFILVSTTWRIKLLALSLAFPTPNCRLRADSQTFILSWNVWRHFSGSSFVPGGPYGLQHSGDPDLPFGMPGLLETSSKHAFLVLTLPTFLVRTLISPVLYHFRRLGHFKFPQLWTIPVMLGDWGEKLHCLKRVSRGFRDPHSILSLQERNRPGKLELSFS